MRGICVVTGLAMALGVPAVVLAQADEQTVESTGSAGVVNGDVPAAKERARKDALRTAVEQVAGAKITSVTSVKDFQLVSDQVTSQVDGLVKSYKVLEEKNEGGVFTVKVSAVVSKSAAMDAFSLALLEAGRPKVAFLIAERMAGSTDFSTGNQERGKTENMLIEYMQERGLSVVNLAGLGGVNLSGIASSGDLTAADAEKLAEKADAQFVVVGKVVGVDAGNVMTLQGFRSYQMSLTFQMFSTSTHEVVAATSKSGTVPCISPNLAPISCARAYKDRVVEPAAQDLMVKAAKWFVRSNVTGAKRVQVIANVPGGYGALTKFIKALQDDVRGVSSVNQRSFTKGRAVLDVELEGGDTNALAAELASKKVGGAAIEVTGVNTDKLEIEIKK